MSGNIGQSFNWPPLEIQSPQASSEELKWITEISAHMGSEFATDMEGTQSGTGREGLSFCQ
eukprot:1152064-Pelagomonas_calceolata.AAC.6